MSTTVQHSPNASLVPRADKDRSFNQTTNLDEREIRLSLTSNPGGFTHAPLGTSISGDRTDRGNVWLWDCLQHFNLCVQGAVLRIPGTLRGFLDRG